MSIKEWYWQESSCCGADIKYTDICVECGEHTEIIEICSDSAAINLNKIKKRLNLFYEKRNKTKL